jgi:NO-binding membrane sensor protein with MHYT domain
VAYVLSVLGSLLGLTCTARARTARTTGQRTWWLILAALAIGGTGIWSMHFMAMLGFTVPKATILYDVPMTAASAVIAVIVVFIGLMIAGTGGRGPVRIAFGGLFAGLGVAAMHYTGMFAMRVEGEVRYDPGLVAASVVIAVVAATVALWFTVTLKRRIFIFGAALVMGVAVCGMHYTGMAAMSVRLEPSRSFDIQGATALSLLVPIAVMVLLVIGGLIFAIGAAASEEDLAGRAYLEARQAQRQKLQAATSSASTSASTRRRQGPATFQRSASSMNPSGSSGAFGSNGSKSGNGTSDATRTTSGATFK